jgi:hypothetical protein
MLLIIWWNFKIKFVSLCSNDKFRLSAVLQKINENFITLKSNLINFYFFLFAAM